MILSKRYNNFLRLYLKIKEENIPIMNREKRIKILKLFKEKNPYPRTKLNFSSQFELLIAVLLSSKTLESNVNIVTSKLFSVANTPKAIIKLGIEGLKEYIKNIGLYNKKAKNIINTCLLILEKHGGKIPKDRELLEALPGIGRKTANIVLNIAFGYPSIAVDTHVFRVCNRSNFAPGKNVFCVEKKLLKVVPKEFKVNCHSWFNLHGKYVCLSRKPHCKFCIIEHLCEFKSKVYI